MKKIISLIAVVAMLCSMCSFTALADYASTLTMATTAEKANAGDEFVVTAAVGTTEGMKSLSFKIVYDANDIELGTSDEADGVADEFAEDIAGGAPLDEVCVGVIGRQSYVDDTYYNTYSGLSSTKKLGDPTIDYQQIGDNVYVAFGYAKNAAISKYGKSENLAMGGVVLKVKTTEAKQTTITIDQATASGADGVDTPCTISNTITLNLNGYGEAVEPEAPTAESIGLTTDKTQVAKVLENVDVKNINGEEYKINSAIAFVSAINADADVVEFGTNIYCEGYDGKLTIKANNPYDVTADIKGFVAAVSSIREANYGKTFTAKAYAVLADGTPVEVEEGATGSYKPAAN